MFMEAMFVLRFFAENIVSSAKRARFVSYITGMSLVKVEKKVNEGSRPDACQILLYE